MFQIQDSFDAHLIYFDKHFQGTQRLYCNSQFKGHVRASYLIRSLTVVLKNLDYGTKMVHISMAGPNANLSLLDNLAIHRKENANGPELVNTGSFSLHVVHGFFGEASKKDRLEPGSIIKIFLQQL